PTRREPPTMDPRPDDHFDHLSTSWTLLDKAHRPDLPAQQQQAARQQVIERYGSLVRRYLGGAFRQEPDAPEAVEECFQEFSLRVMRGAFKGAAPERGRFRAYLRTYLSNLGNDYRRNNLRRAESLGEYEPAAQEEPPAGDQEFAAMWREDL